MRNIRRILEQKPRWKQLGERCARSFRQAFHAVDVRICQFWGFCCMAIVLRQREFTCPVCSTVFRAQVCSGWDGYGGKRTDFHVKSASIQPLPFEIVTCFTCGFTEYDQDFGDRVDAECQSFVREVITPMLTPDKPLDGSVRYEIAARIARNQDRFPDQVAWRWLRAAWCCVDEGDTEAERYYRLKAVKLYEEILAGFNTVERERRAELTYLTGELWRRIGDLARAKTWFAKVEHEVHDPEADKKWVALAQQQTTSPREWF